MLRAHSHYDPKLIGGVYIYIHTHVYYQHNPLDKYLSTRIIGKNKKQDEQQQQQQQQQQEEEASYIRAS